MYRFECLVSDFPGYLKALKELEMSSLDLHTDNLETVRRWTSRVNYARAGY